MTAVVDLDLGERINALYLDPEACAQAAGLRYVLDAEPGVRRLRRGRGFSFVDAQGRPVSKDERTRLLALAVPPAWREVWLSTDADGHLLATGIDDRGRKQYLYNERWREMRELLNFTRLIPFSDQLPAVRRIIDKQLRRRTLDRERVLAAMVRIIDSTAIRIGNEVYADENESYGLTTLTRKHVDVSGDIVRMSFTAKAGKQAEMQFHDRAVARVVSSLLTKRARRLFTVDGTAIDSDAVNAALSDWSKFRITAKDFRTWHGTRVAFEWIENLPDGMDSDQAALGAVDSAAEWLGNTRAVARASYVHPQLLSSVEQGMFDSLVPKKTPRAPAGLTAPERRLREFLIACYAEVPVPVLRDSGRSS